MTLEYSHVLQDRDEGEISRSTHLLTETELIWGIVMDAIGSSHLNQREVVEHLDGSVTEYSYFEPSADAMDKLTRVLFEQHWRDVMVGPCIEGAVFEIRFSEAPKLSMLDGYLTVNLGSWHFHLCIAEHKGNRSLELRRKRQVARVALFETRGQPCGGGRSWGVRMWNGFGEQMTTVFLPNPRLSDEFRPLREPNWERLKLWYELREQFLGERQPSNIAVAQAATDSESSEATEH